MARPERNTVDYFPFICEDGKKMYYIEETYGNDGFATFVKLLRELAKTEFHYLDLSKPTTQMFLSAKCKVSKEVLISIINDLVELGKFDKLLWDENKIVWCQGFVDSIQDAYSKRKNKCITYEGLIQLLIGLGVRKQGLGTLKDPVKPQSKVEYTKEKKTKEDLPPDGEPEFSFEKSLLNYGFEKQLVSDWLKVRKTKRGTNTQTAFDDFLKTIQELESTGREKNDILRIMVKKSWVGLEVKWIENLENENKPVPVRKINEIGSNYDVTPKEDWQIGMTFDNSK